MKTLPLLILFTLLLTLPLDAKEAPIYTIDPKGVAVEGHDVTTFFTKGEPERGSPKHQMEWRGVKWYFANEANRLLFEQNPERYAPQYGGYCVWAIAHRRKTGGIIKFWKIIDNKLYLLCSQEALDQWLQDRETIEKKAEQNWPW